MRVNNVIREKIDRVLSKQYDKKLNELYADRRAQEKAIRTALKEIEAEANKKAAELIANYPGTTFQHWGNDAPFINSVNAFVLPEDEELYRKATDLRDRKKELAMDMEIRCTLAKEADDFFEMLNNLEL